MARKIKFEYMEFESYTDKQIVDGIVNNDKETIDFFFNKKCSKLLSYILLNVFDGRIDKRELVSELFLYLAKDDWYKVRQFDFRSKLMTWLSVVAIRFFQKKRDDLIENTSSETLYKKINETGHNPGISIDRRIDIHAAIMKLPNKRYKKVIQELDLRDACPEKIAKEMKITIDNLYNIHRRAHVQLCLVMGIKEDYV